MNNRISLHVLGLTASQMQSEVYAVIMAETNGLRRIPIVIGAAEAQSIAMALDGIKPPRPITHDLFVSFAHGFGVKLQDVFINRYKDGIFSSELTFSDGDRTIVIDSRTSDAIALALRTHTPIYTTREIIEATGFVLDEEDGSFVKPERSGDVADDVDSDETYSDRDDYHAEPKPENYSIEQLEQTLAELIENEDYEEAARISDILNRKKGFTENNE